MSPGGINFETSPFKFTQEYMEIIGGENSDNYLKFKMLFLNGLSSLIKNKDEIFTLIEIMKSSSLPCFETFNF